MNNDILGSLKRCFDSILPLFMRRNTVFWVEIAVTALSITAQTAIDPLQ